MNEWLSAIGGILNAQLFEIGGTQVRVSTLVTVVVIFGVTIGLSRWLSLFVERSLKHRGWRPGNIGTIAGLVRYLVLVAGFGVALDTAGIELTALFAAGALFAVGLGFAMQSIAENFVAGLIILSERSIKPGDILSVEGRVVQVRDVGIRASVARTRDGEDLIVPNAVLIQTTVTNHTLRDSIYRIRVSVGVVYSADMNVVKETLMDVATTVSEAYAIEGHPPQVIMTEFGNNSVNWEVAIWTNDPWRSRLATSNLHEAVWWAFKEKNVVIAFPQLDVHFDPPLVAGLERLASSAA